MPNDQLPRIAVTMGDPAGVGPELCLRLLAEPKVLAQCVPIVLGDWFVLQRVAERCALPLPSHVVNLRDWNAAGGLRDEPTVVDFQQLICKGVEPGVISAQTGAASYAYVAAAIRAALAGEVDAIATAPLHKEALHAAGVPFPGHTEILASLTSTPDVVMMLTSDEITCSLVTAHVGLRDVPSLLTVDAVLKTIELTVEAMRRLRGREPRITVCGLNPHAGEGGLFGQREEERWIAPAIEAARERGVRIVGPLPPDTAFLPARRLATDAYVCMYHDQGLIPLKMLAFDSGVNITLGLPIIRTSVDHGTALDIAWQGVASANSLFEAVLLAARLSRREATRSA